MLMAELFGETCHSRAVNEGSISDLHSSILLILNNAFVPDGNLVNPTYWLISAESCPQENFGGDGFPVLWV